MTTSQPVDTAPAVVRDLHRALAAYINGKRTDKFHDVRDAFDPRLDRPRATSEEDAWRRLDAHRTNVVIPDVAAALASPAFSNLPAHERAALTEQALAVVHQFHQQVVNFGTAATLDASLFRKQLNALDDALLGAAASAAAAVDRQPTERARTELASAERDMQRANVELEMAIVAGDVTCATQLREAVTVTLPTQVDKARERLLNLVVAERIAEASPAEGWKREAELEVREADAAVRELNAQLRAANERLQRAHGAALQAAAAHREVDARRREAVATAEAHRAAAETARVARVRTLVGVA